MNFSVFYQESFNPSQEKRHGSAKELEKIVKSLHLVPAFFLVSISFIYFKVGTSWSGK